MIKARAGYKPQSKADYGLNSGGQNLFIALHISNLFSKEQKAQQASKVTITLSDQHIVKTVKRYY